MCGYMSRFLILEFVFSWFVFELIIECEEVIYFYCFIDII